jgi:hypothetical protein
MQWSETLNNTGSLGSPAWKLALGHLREALNPRLHVWVDLDQELGEEKQCHQYNTLG